jgi:hypothetical protein
MKYPNPGIPEKERVEMVELSLNCIALHNHRQLSLVVVGPFLDKILEKK